MRTVFLGRDLRRSFTLIELLIVIGIIAILAAIVILAINPKKQLNDASSSATRSHLNTILKSLNQFQVDFERVPQQINLSAIVDTPREICRDEINQFQCAFNGYASFQELTPDYIADVPVDPEYATDRGTGYWVRVDDDGRFHVSSPNLGISLP